MSVGTSTLWSDVVQIEDDSVLQAAAASGFDTHLARRAPGDDAVGYLHAEHRRYSADRRILDPGRPESLIYRIDVDAGGRDVAPLVHGRPAERVRRARSRAGALPRRTAHTEGLSHRGEPPRDVIPESTIWAVIP